MYIVTKNILDLMQEKGLNARQFELKVGLPNATIQNWRNGKYNPSAKALQKVADYFNLPLSFFYNDRDESTSTAKEKPSVQTEGYSEYIKALDRLNIRGDDDAMRELIVKISKLTNDQKDLILKMVENLKDNN